MYCLVSVPRKQFGNVQKFKPEGKGNQTCRVKPSCIWRMGLCAWCYNGPLELATWSVF
jgi:hypothetical protein